MDDLQARAVKSLVDAQFNLMIEAFDAWSDRLTHAELAECIAVVAEMLAVRSIVRAAIEGPNPREVARSFAQHMGQRLEPQSALLLGVFLNELAAEQRAPTVAGHG